MSIKKVLTLLISTCILWACTPKTNIGELIQLRNKYQLEKDILHATLAHRQYELYGNFDAPLFLVATWEETQRENLCNDSIEILNIEIQKYKEAK